MSAIASSPIHPGDFRRKATGFQSQFKNDYVKIISNAVPVQGRPPVHFLATNNDRQQQQQQQQQEDWSTQNNEVLRFSVCVFGFENGEQETLKTGKFLFPLLFGRSGLVGDGGWALVKKLLTGVRVSVFHFSVSNLFGPGSSSIDLFPGREIKAFFLWTANLETGKWVGRSRERGNRFRQQFFISCLGEELLSGEQE